MLEISTFNLYLPDCEYLGGLADVENLTIYAYEAGNFLSIFSGSYILNTSGSKWSNYGISGSYTSDYFTFDLIINNNNYLFGNIDESYDIIVYDYYSGNILNIYSGSTLSQMSSKDLNELSIQYIG